MKKDLRYLNNSKKFIDYAWSVFTPYFKNKEAFMSQFYAIGTDEKKNLFLRISSFYKFLIADGKFEVVLEGEKKYVNYIDQTYKYLAIAAFIEALHEQVGYVDFYEWLISSKSKVIFPLSKETLHEEYRTYKAVYGATRRFKAFFLQLDQQSQDFLRARIIGDGSNDSISKLADSLYQIRSDFVHAARLVVEFIPGTMISTRNDSLLETTMQFDDLSKIFERGLLLYFGFRLDEN